MNIVREQREQNNSLIKVTVGEKDYGDAVEKSLREKHVSIGNFTICIHCQKICMNVVSK